MDEDKTLVVFQDKKIRRKWFNDEWWFVAADIVAVLTDSKDPSGYLKDMRRRDEGFKEGWGQIATPLAFETSGGSQKINCVSTKGAFRLAQSIPSKKAEPFKMWLAQVGYERIQEIENPEISQKRMRELYRQKGYSDEWIEKRVRGIAIRDELTDEWDKRGIKASKEYSILTSEISKATFGLTPSEYKKFKGLKKENLRDHMNDLELIFTISKAKSDGTKFVCFTHTFAHKVYSEIKCAHYMLGEASTTRIAKNKDAQGFIQNKKAAKEGGAVAGIAREELEKRSKQKVSTSENYLDEIESVKRKRIK